MNIIVLQAIFTVLIFLLTLLCILLPLKIYPRDRAIHTNHKSQRIMAFCNCVSGGVFLGVCFVGLMPFCKEKFESSFNMIGVTIDYPLSELGVVIGFFLILLIEQSIQAWQGRKKTYEEAKELAETPNKYVFFSSDSDITGDNDSEYDGPTLGPPAGDLASTSGETETTAMLSNVSEPSADHTIPHPPNGTTLPLPQGKCKKPKRKRAHLHSSRPSRGHRHGRNQMHGHSHGGGGHGHSHAIDIFNQSSGLRCFILMIALGIHASFEGVALGLQDEVGKLVNLFIGVLVHECLVSFAMGISLAKQNLKVGTIIKVSLLLCSMIPVGNVVGIAIGVVHTFAGSLTSAILQAIAAGTFLYVIFLEILPAEINDPHDRLLKVFFLFFGFGLVACLQVATGGH